MREIKFRVWLTTARGKLTMVKNIPLEEMSLLKVNPGAIVMQYTGLKDKTDKEIYEGDIVEYITDLSKSKGRTVIKDCDLIEGFREFQYDEYSNYNVNRESVKIIGNIYENPELLEIKNE